MAFSAEQFDILTRIGLDTSQYDAALSGTAAKAKATSQTMNKVLNVAIAATAAVLGTGVKMAMEFEDQFSNINTLIDVTPEKFNEMKAAALDTFKTLPVELEAVTTGYYNMLSAGAGVTETMLGIDLAARAATAGLTSVDTAVTAGMATINAYGMSMSELEDVYDAQFLAVKKGVMTYEQLSASIGAVLPSFAAYKIEMDEMYAGLAVITKSGIEAQNASTAYGRMIDSMVENSQKWADVGIPVFDEASGAFRSVRQVVNDLSTSMQDMTVQQKSSMIESLGLNVRARRAVLAMVNDIEETNKVFDAFTYKSGAMGEAFDKSMESSKKQMKTFGNIMKSSLIESTDSLTKMLGSSLFWLNKNQVATTSFTKAMVLLTTGIGLAAAGLKVYNTVRKTMGLQTKLLTTGVLKWAGGIGVAVAAIGLAVAALKQHEANVNKNIDATSSNVTAIEKMADAYKSLDPSSGTATMALTRMRDMVDNLGLHLDITSGNVNALSTDIRELAIEELNTRMNTLAFSIEELNSRTDASATKWLRTMRGMDEWTFGEKIMNRFRGIEGMTEKVTERSLQYETQLKELMGTSQYFNAAMEMTSDELENQVNALEDSIKGMDDSKSQTKLAVFQLDEYKSALEKVITKEEETAAAKAKVEKAARSLGGVMKALGVESESSVRVQIQAYQDLYDMAGTTEYEQQQAIDKLEALYTKLGDTKGFNAYLDSVGRASEGTGLLSIRIKDGERAISDTVDSLGYLKDGLYELQNGEEDFREEILADISAWDKLTNSTKKTTDETDKQNKIMVQAVNQVAKLTDNFKNLGPSAKAGIDLIQTALTGLLSGGLDPISLGFQALGFLLADNTTKVTVNVQSIESLLSTYGDWGTEIQHVRESIEELNGAFDLELVQLWRDNIEQSLGLLAVGDNATGHGYWNALLEQMAADAARLLSDITLDIDVSNTMASISEVTEEILRMIAYYGDALDTTGLNLLLENQIAAGYEMLKQLDPTSQAYRELWAEIYEARNALKLLNGEEILQHQALEDSANKTDALKLSVDGANLSYKKYRKNVDEASTATKGLTDSTQKTVDSIAGLTVDFGRDINKWQSYIDGLNGQKFTLAENLQSELSGIQVQLDKAKATYDSLSKKRIELLDEYILKRREILDAGNTLLDLMKPVGIDIDLLRASIGGAFDAMQAGADGLNLNRIANDIAALTGETKGLQVAWTDLQKSLFSDFDVFTSDIKTAQEALDQMDFFKMDLSGSEAEASINAAIFRLQDYLSELNPDSDAYAEASAAIQALIERYGEMGGVLDETSAEQWYLDQAEAAQSSAQTQFDAYKEMIEALTAEFRDNVAEVNIDISAAQTEIDRLESEYSAAIMEMQENVAVIDIDISAALKKINQLRGSMEFFTGRGVQEAEPGNSGYTPNPINSSNTYAPVLNNAVTVNPTPINLELNVTVDEKGNATIQNYDIDNVINPRIRVNDKRTKSSVFRG